jgi:hypothetical protein
MQQCYQYSCGLLQHHMQQLCSWGLRMRHASIKRVYVQHHCSTDAAWKGFTADNRYNCCQPSARTRKRCAHGGDAAALGVARRVCLRRDALHALPVVLNDALLARPAK